MNENRTSLAASLRGSPNCTRPVAADIPETHIAAFPTSEAWGKAGRVDVTIGLTRKNRFSLLRAALMPRQFATLRFDDVPLFVERTPPKSGNSRI